MAPNWKNVALSATSGALALVAVAPALLPLLGDVDWSPRWMDSSNASLSKSGEYNPYRDFNRWVNNIILPTSVTSYFANNYSEEAAYYITSYVRDFIMGTIVYWVTAGLWHYTIYDLFGEELFTKKGRSFPTTETFLDTIRLAQSSVVLYAALPVMSEYLIENRWTKAYFYIDEVGGWSQYLAYLIIYIMLVEIGIYWVHRTLHTNKFLYKYFHALHHKYNKPSTLSPWVSIAFNPIDGLMQASPYVFFLFFVPVHYFTHVFLLFFSGVWATNIHDSVPFDTEPIMGAKYHTIHHTHYHYNFGQWFTFCDAYWGTLRDEKQIASMSRGKSEASAEH